VKIVVARAVPIDDTSEFVATLRSRDSADIMPQVEGQVTRIFVKAGDRVARGAPLVQIDPAKQQAAVRSQQDTRSARVASLALARQQYQRVAALFAEGIASQQDMDHARQLTRPRSHTERGSRDPSFDPFQLNEICDQLSIRRRVECTPKVRHSGIEHFRAERRTANEELAAVYAGVQGPGGRPIKRVH
jgi:multidrug efflux pump subunit AcrA (membrane-fusion protein)